MNIKITLLLSVCLMQNLLISMEKEKEADDEIVEEKRYSMEESEQPDQSDLLESEGIPPLVFDYDEECCVNCFLWWSSWFSKEKNIVME